MSFLELTKEDKALGPDNHPRVLKEMAEQDNHDVNMYNVLLGYSANMSLCH